MKLSSGLIAGVLLTLAVPVCAQSLGDLAKKELERRKTAPTATKTYTNDDLKKMPAPPSPEPGTVPAAKDPDKDPATPGDAKAEGAKPAEAVEPAKPAKDEAYWRGRITTAREDVRRNEMFRDALQTRIDALSADFSGHDDPYQRATIADDRQKALAEIERVKTEIEKLTKQIADIEEEARRAGVPPGWLR